MKRIFIVLFGMVLVVGANAENIPQFVLDQWAAEAAEQAEFQAWREAQAQAQLAAQAPAQAAQPVQPVVATQPAVAAQRAAVATRGVQPVQRAGVGAAPDANRTVAQRNVATTRAAVAPTVAGQANVVRAADTPSRVITPASRTGVQQQGTVAAQRAGTVSRAAVQTTAPMQGGAVAARAATATPSLHVTPNIDRAATPRTPIARSAVTSPFEIASPLTPATNQAGPSMEELAALTDFCRAAYMNCMDGFCAVVDDAMGRCACSANVQQYVEVQQALRNVTDELQQVAIAIQYLGLSADEVTALFSQTEAEIAMGMGLNAQDTSQLRSDLNRIQGMVLDVRTDVNTGAAQGGALNLLDFGSMLQNMQTGGDLFGSMDFMGLLGGNQTQGNIVRQRGEELFRSAQQRCRSILDDCRRQGVNVNLITGHYDMEIDRQCVIFERELNEANMNMRRTVVNAQNVLRMARLQVHQNANQFDARGCIQALDQCMQNEFVCGRDFENCLDPTGRFIVAGRLVPGSMPGNTANAADATGLYISWASTGTATTTGVSLNPWGSRTVANVTTQNTLGDAINNSMSSIRWNQTNNMYTGPHAIAMIEFIMNRIGTIDAYGRAHGMCANVMNRCQMITRTTANRTYATNNPVVRDFLSRALMQIRAGQDRVITNFAETCFQDVHSCLQQNQAMSGFNTGQGSELHNVTMHACRALAQTCVSVGQGNISVSPGASDQFMCQVWVARGGRETGDACVAALAYTPAGTGGGGGG
ncbi:MAG: hypothetical protein FWC83_00270, partial [Alphaproteobacteria bacterium]|nr:hypothetical protein [Alphaproteobacteria bacterium]